MGEIGSFRWTLLFLVLSARVLGDVLETFTKVCKGFKCVSRGLCGLVNGAWGKGDCEVLLTPPTGGSLP